MTITNRKFYLPGGLTNGEGSLPVAITVWIRQSGRPLMSNPDFCEIILKSDQQFLRRRFFKTFFMSIYCKKPPFTRAMCNRQIKLLQSFWKGSPKEHSCEIISKSDSWFQRTRHPTLCSGELKCKGKRRKCSSGVLKLGIVGKGSTLLFYKKFKDVYWPWWQFR